MDIATRLVILALLPITQSNAHPSPASNTSASLVDGDLTSLDSKADITCFQPDTHALFPIINLYDCLEALDTTTRLTPSDLFLPALWGSSDMQSSKILYHTPAYWKSKVAEEKGEGCQMVFDATMWRMKKIFSAVQLAFYGSQVVQKCVLPNKMPLGGRMMVRGGWVLDVIGKPDWRPPVDDEVAKVTAQ